jgi:hypothetical protein
MNQMSKVTLARDATIHSSGVETIAAGDSAEKDR